ncbi:putative entry exclusion protein TrbK-alt [Sphingomonas sp. 28-63-12]|uniref:putative entry exclusion protein TrbK-alt n=1 Tax=Sphingomonas sp. 28-63-12 TaxID=1970434 RepID=UPI000BD7A345|nr:MAG: conjugal transfer protein TrbK [Sphingomonas sp. 28-63-12]
MDTKLLARIGAIIFVAIAITMTAIEMSRPKTDGRNAVPTAPIAEAPADPLIAEMRRCQGIGEAGASDPACLRAWAENRRRFLAPGARPEASLAADTATKEP